MPLAIECHLSSSILWVQILQLNIEKLRRPINFMLDAQRAMCMLLLVADERLRGGHMLCFLDDGQGMSPGLYSSCTCYVL